MPQPKERDHVDIVETRAVTGNPESNGVPLPADTPLGAFESSSSVWHAARSTGPFLATSHGRGEADLIRTARGGIGMRVTLAGAGVLLLAACSGVAAAGRG